MQPEPAQHEVARDPILDGRDSLRLVKLRLALTLIAVAILPIAAVSPLVRAVAEEARFSHHQLLTDQARTTATGVEREIEFVRTTATQLLTDAAIIEAVAPKADAKARAAASSRLANLTGRPTGTVVGVSLVTADGVRVAVGATVDVPVLPPGVIVSGLATVNSETGDPRLLLVATSQPGEGPARSVILRLSVPALLGTASPSTGIPGRAIRLADPTGLVVAESDGPFDPSALPGEMLDIATMAAHDSDGRAAVEVAGLEGWSIVVGAPIPLVALPVQALSALGAMLLLLVAFTLWMARQILRPAAQLEASRSRLRELYESAHEAALQDSLTGLGNHRAFQEAVARMVEGARRYGTAFSLVLLDIDEFKRINDTRGHAVGDQLLAEVGDLIQAAIRHTDAGFRVGGDEFAVLLPHTDAGGAIVLARRLLARGLEDRNGGTYPGPISFSAGVTACPEFGATRLELTAQADAALYRGKRSGRTVVTIYDPEKDHGHVDEGMRAELSSAITAVIESGTLRPVYQPIVEMQTGRVLGYEGLVRVPRESTFAHAGALFDAAEVAGRVHDLDRAALEVVLRGAHDIDESMSLSLNVSPRTLEANEFNATAFLSILRRHGVRPGRVIMELTERESVRDPERLRAALIGVQDAGVRVAADDVGAGNAGLRLLSQFRFDVVKIDLSLVQRAGEDKTASVLRSLVDMANRLGAMTIAEGVETSAQLRTIRRLGITAGQGYLLGRPSAERDLSWVDLIALEQREDVPVPIRPEPVEPVAPVAPAPPSDRRDPLNLGWAPNPFLEPDPSPKPNPFPEPDPRDARGNVHDQDAAALAPARRRSMASLKTSKASNE
jgi:diguanylate cyclase (GGDEF)-like protein